MNDDELKRLLAGAFDAQARAEVGDRASPPPPHFAEADDLAPGHRAHVRKHRIIRVLAPLAAAAAVVAVVATVPTITGNGGSKHGAADQPSASGVVSGRGSQVQPPTAQGARSVHIKLFNADGSVYGVGMPVIAYFSRRITDASALTRATTVTVNGRPERGAWYFEPSAAGHGPLEGHFRLQHYWPAHARVHVGIAAQGRTAGSGFVYDDSLTLDFHTAAADIATVQNHELTLTRDGTRVATFPVSLGAAKTPTTSGTKVIMEKGVSVCMSGPGYHECGVKDTQRLTYDGEFLHAAPWNVKHIEHHVDSSNGCTNLLPADAKTLYRTMRVGDLVLYPDTDGPMMTFGQGFGDWDVPWSEWLTGGTVPTR